MNKLKRNLLDLSFNPPAFAVGDIWNARGKVVDTFYYENDKGEKKQEDIYETHTFLITELIESEPDIVRCALVSNHAILNDGYDIAFKKKDMANEDKRLYTNLYQIVLRATDGPVLKKNLTVYWGTLSPKKTKQVLNSLKIPLDHNEIQEEMIAEKLEALQSFRERVWEKCL
jgi:hypothetical protein